MVTIKSIIKYITLILLLICFYACEQIVMEDNISKEIVTLIAPQEDESFTSTSVMLTWAPITNAKKYHLQIAKPNFTNPSQIVLDTEIATTTYNAQLNIGNYQWRVQASNGNYVTPFSLRKINILSNQNFQENTVNLVSPTNNTASKNTTQTLSWQSVIGATGYTLQVYDTSNTIINTLNLTSTTSAFTFPEGSFTWRVRATNGSQNTLFSSNAITIDGTSPNTPTLTAPANATVTTNATVSFQWNRTPIVGSTETDKIYIYRDSALTNLYSQTSATSPYSITLPTGTYYWFVKAFDTAGNESNRSNVNSLTIN